MKLTRTGQLTGCFVAFAFLIALARSAASAVPPDDVVLRVGLVRFFRSVTTVTVSSVGGLSIRDARGKQSTDSISNCTRARFTASRGVISVEADGCAPISACSSLVITPGSPENPLCIESPARPTRQYRGSIEISAKGGLLSLVNVVGLEDYVRGVLPEEMPASYPLESLKAQAVAARTYALANRGKHKSEGYDLCDTNMCQHYGGAAAEKAKCSQAVDETRGIVLLYNGNPAQVLYSTDCGGITQDYSESHPGKSIPYLRAVTDPSDIPHRSWELVYTLKELEEKLVRAGVAKARGLTDIRIAKTGPSGRALELVITGADGAAVVPGTILRSALGSSTLKSTLYTLEVMPDRRIAIRGKGWGHGHGLCQVGARGLALPPHCYTCDRILAHYFPGTELRTVTTPGVITQQPARAEQQEREELKLKVRLKAPGHL